MVDRTDVERGGRRMAVEETLTVREEPDVPVGAAALAKGLTLLDMVADASRPVRFAELLKRSGLPKPTFARILRTLIAFRLVRHDEKTGTYTLGQRFLELSHRVWDTFDLNSAALPELERLSAELGETVARSEEHTSELQSRENLVCRLLLEKTT